MIELKYMISQKYIKDKTDLIRFVNKNNGWELFQPDEFSNFDKLRRIRLLICSEIIESMEALRHRDENNFKEEIADVFIRIFDFIGNNPDFISYLHGDLQKFVDPYVNSVFFHDFTNESKTNILDAFNYYLYRTRISNDQPINVVRTNLIIELAVCYKILVKFCEETDLAIDPVIMAKIEHNKERGYKHGNKVF